MTFLAPISVVVDVYRIIGALTNNNVNTADVSL